MVRNRFWSAPRFTCEVWEALARDTMSSGEFRFRWPVPTSVTLASPRAWPGLPSVAPAVCRVRTDAFSTVAVPVKVLALVSVSLPVRSRPPPLPVPWPMTPAKVSVASASRKRVWPFSVTWLVVDVLCRSLMCWSLFPSARVPEELMSTSAESAMV